MGLFKVRTNTGEASLFARFWLPAAILIAAALLLPGGDGVREQLRFERAAIGDGELWRLISGHFVHLGTGHFLLNAFGLGLVWFLTGRFLDWSQWALAMAVAIAVIDLGLWHLNPALQWYVGLSGVLHALLAAGFVAGLSPRRRELPLLAFVLILKIAWEQVVGPLPGSEPSSGGPVVVDAHLYGIVAGIVSGAWVRIRVRSASSI